MVIYSFPVEGTFAVIMVLTLIHKRQRVYGAVISHAATTMGSAGSVYGRSAAPVPSPS